MAAADAVIAYREALATAGAELVGPDGVDPRRLIIDAGRAYDPADERRWVRARRLPAGDDVLVPLEFAVQSRADLPAGYEPLITPITNGLGAGLSFEAALGHALRELVQRDGNSVAYRALDRGIAIDVALPAVAPGVRPLAKAAISDLGHADVYVVGDDDDPPHPLSLTACGCRPRDRISGGYRGGSRIDHERAGRWRGRSRPAGGH